MQLITLLPSYTLHSLNSVRRVARTNYSLFSVQHFQSTTRTFLGFCKLNSARTAVMSCASTVRHPSYTVHSLNGVRRTARTNCDSLFPFVWSNRTTWSLTTTLDARMLNLSVLFVLQKLVTTIFQAYQDAGLSLPGLLRPREIGLSLPCLSRERFVTTGLLWQVCLSANLIVTDLPLGITLPLVKLDSNSSASRQAW